MTKRQIVGVTNFLSLTAVVLLVYWVFAFSLSVVFGLKIFKENLTQLFGMSVLGILAVLAGALVVNISFNLSRIAESSEQAASTLAPSNGILKRLLLLLLPFPIIAGGMYYGDIATTQRKEKVLIESANHVINTNQKFLEGLVNYSFSKEYLKEASNILSVISKEDENFPHVAAITIDSISAKDVLLRFGSYSYWNDQSDRQKSDFIYSCSKTERDYLKKALAGKISEPRYSASDGHYELYYPVNIKGKRLVLYFTDYARYGKYGSS